jgi:glycosyltransferase involved in cell wall biosynthesis
MTESEVKRVLVLVPAYNAATYLPELIKRCRENIGDSYLLFINDGSTDDTLAILKREDVNYVSFHENRGKGAALKAGFDYALGHGFEAVLTLDADLQHLPEEVPRFLAVNDGRHLVIGTRSIEVGKMPLARWLVNNVTSMIISVFSSQRVRDSQSGFRLIPVSVLRAMRLDSARYDFESELLFKAGALNCTVAEVPVTTIYAGSHSYINPLKDTWRFIRQIWLRIWS